MNKVKECPCCGGKAKVKAYDPYDGYQGDNTKFQVVCEECGVNTGAKSTVEEAIEAWNRRNETGENLSAENKELRKIVDCLQAESVSVSLKCGDLTERNAELEEENKILCAQMDVVRMIFEGRGRK